jgi:CubicO group peptidase (beta-lactamase class C family)
MKVNILIISLMAALAIRPSGAQPSEAYFPEGAFRTSSPESQGVDSDRLNRMLTLIASNAYGFHGIIVVKNGYKILDACFFPYNNGIKHQIYSCTKSFTSALVGTAIEKGEIPGVEGKLSGFFPNRPFKNPSEGKDAITVENLLMMTSGVEWREDGSYGSSDSWVRMLASADPIGFCLDLPLLDRPGSRFYYNSGSSHILSAILRHLTGRSAAELAEERLFAPMGIEDKYWAKDRQGLNFGGTSLYLKPEDMAKFGYLYLRNGRWGERQLVPSSWVEESTRKRVDTPKSYPGSDGYGYQWWMNDFGGYSARGYGAQFIFVLPLYDMVVVTTAGLTGSDFTLPGFMLEHFIIPAIKAEGPLPENEESNRKLSATLERIGRAPPLKTIEPLPKLAAKISGKSYAMEDKSLISIDFSDASECVVKNGTELYRIGLDRVWRINHGLSLGPLPKDSSAACKGEWLDDLTFRVTWQTLNDMGSMTITCDFKGRAMALTAKGPSANWTLKGKMK